MDKLLEEGMSRFNELKGGVNHNRMGMDQNTILYSWVVYLNMCDMMYEKVKDQLLQLEIEDLDEKYDEMKRVNPMASITAARAEEIRSIKSSYSRYDLLNKSMIKSFEKLDSNPLVKLAAVKLHEQFSSWFKLEMEGNNNGGESQ